MNTLLPDGRRRTVARALLVTSTILAAGIVLPAAAQITPPAPVHQSVDANGVDLFVGTMSVASTPISMGQGDPQGLSYFFIYKGAGWTDNVTASLNSDGSVAIVRLGGSSDDFTVSGNTFTSRQGKGATLTFSGTIYTYTAGDGTVVRFNNARSGDAPYYANLGRALDVTRPSGAKLVYDYGSVSYCSKSKAGNDGDICLTHSTAYRVSTITSSYGYQLALSYQSDDTGELDDSTNGLDLRPWSTVTGATITNLRSGNSASLSESASVGAGSFSVTDAMGRTTTYRMDGLGRLLGITRPGSASENVTIGYNAGLVSSVTTAAGSWSYARSDGNGERTVSVTDPASQTTTYVFDLTTALMKRTTDALNHVTSWTYDPANPNRLKSATAPEGNSVAYTYDSRGNVTGTVLTSKDGTQTLSTHADYDATCSNAVTCNLPNWTTDAKGNRTDYSYDPAHGGVTAVTAPAGANGVHPQARYAYSALTDQFGGTVWKQTYGSTCRTSVATGCAGTADEIVTGTDYGSIANNLLPQSMTKRAGDSSVSATSLMGYDSVGNVMSTTNPVGTQTQYVYDADRELTETISADPDGAGPMKPRAARMTYNLDGTVAAQEVGTDTGGNFQSLQQVTTTYDGALRPIRQVATAGGTTYGVADIDYDAANRLTCTAVRMNPAAFGTRPYACNMGVQGADGPDRITLTYLDQVGRPISVVKGYGSGDQATETISYAANGKVDYVVDGKGNPTHNTYDGFDRTIATYYPSTTAGSGQIDPGDFDGYAYDANGNVIDHRPRDNQHVTYGYDALNRMTSDSQGHSYSYDNLGQLTVATDTNNAAATFGYDALGRKTSQGNPFGGTATMQYDAAGRRTRLTWADGFYVTYDYDPLGEMTGIHENGGTVLASFGYDDLGRRTSIGRANGASTTYSYDAARLTGLTLNGAPANSFTFGYNAAGQITSRTSSNDAYAWAPSANAAKNYAANGLNQYTQVGSVSPSYDGRGNTTTAGGGAYGYNLDNQLTNYPGGYLYRTALGQWLDASVEQRWMVYDGDRTIEEYGYDQTVKRRYVYGPGTDEPLVWYEGSGTSDRRFLHADERGSVVAVTDGAGNLSAINTYDEYGNPGAGNVGRFQYTGQKWLPAAGLYDYKARMYSPSLGRFLQTDPIGYADGLNWYNYAGGDPVNGIDPTGTSCTGSLFDFCPSTLGGTISSTNPGSLIHDSTAGELLDAGAGYAIANKAANIWQSNKGNVIASLSDAASVDAGDVLVIGTRIAQATTPPSNLPGGPYSAKPSTPGNKPGSFQGPKQPSGPRPQAQWVPPESQGGPPGSQGYWKVQLPGQQGWQRYSTGGQPLTPDQAHPNPLGPTRSPFFLGPIGALLCALFCESPAY